MAQPGTLTIVNGPIVLVGEALSEVLDCSAGQLMRITMPAAWDPATNLTFQISTDGQFFNDLFDHLGNEVMIAVRPGTAVLIPLDYMRSAVFIKFRSGRRDDPVPQNEQREFAVVLETT